MKTEEELVEKLKALNDIIGRVKEARDIADMPGGERLIKLLYKSLDDETRKLQSIDPGSTALIIEYTKYQYCKKELGKIINYLEHAQDLLTQYEQKRIDLNKDVDAIRKAADHRERVRM